MQRHIFNLLFLISTVFLFSCENEDVPSETTIVINKQHVKVGEEITVKSVGGKPIYHKWDFQNNNTSGDPEAKIAFSAPGRYIIKLTTIDFQNETHVATAVVLVGDVYFNGFRMTNFKFTDGAGNPWDSDGTGPDLTFSVTGLAGNNSFGYTIANLMPQNLPLNVPYSNGLKVGSGNLSIFIHEFETNGPNSRLAFKKTVNPYDLLLNSQELTYFNNFNESFSTVPVSDISANLELFFSYR